MSKLKLKFTDKKMEEIYQRRLKQPKEKELGRKLTRSEEFKLRDKATTSFDYNKELEWN